MKLYRKYVLTETLISCSSSVVLFVALLLAGNAMRDIINWLASGKLNIVETFKILGILVPSVTSYALPLGITTGILIVIGRMSSQNEILSMKSSGIGLLETAAPILYMALISSLFSAYVNLYYAPNSISNYRQSFKKFIKQNPMKFLEPHVFNDYFKKYLLYFDQIKNEEFKNMRVWQFDENKKMEAYLFAKSGTIKFDDAEGNFVLDLKSCNVEKMNKSKSESDGPAVPQFIYFDNTSFKLPAEDFFGPSSPAQKGYRHMTLSELLLKKYQLKQKISELPYGNIRSQITLINMQISSRIANAVGVFVMALLAIPLGIKTKRANTAFNTVIAFAVCILYYFVMVAFSWLGDKPKLRPDILILVPNVILLITGISLFKRALRH